MNSTSSTDASRLGSTSPEDRRIVFRLIALAAFLTALTFLFFRPGAADLVTSLAPDVGDPRFNLAILKWGMHQLDLGLPDFWNAPFFHPTEGAIALSDHMFGPALQAWLLGGLGLGAIAAFNVLFLSSFVLCGITTAYVLRRSGASWAAAVFCALAFAFAPYRLSHLSHLQVLLAQWIPVTLWFFDRLLAQPSWRRLLPFAVFYALHASGGNYLAYMIHFPMAALLLNRYRDLLEHVRRPRALAVLAVGALACAAVLAPLFLPYLEASERLDLSRGTAEWRHFGGSLVSYVQPANFNHYFGKLHRPWARPENALFAGLLPSLLILWGLTGMWRRYRERDLSPQSRGRQIALWALAALAALGWVAAELHTWTGFDRFEIFGIEGRTDGYLNPAYALLLGGGLWLLLYRRWRGAWPLRFCEMATWERGVLFAGAVCFVLSLPVLYAPLAQIVPGLDGMRVPARFHGLTSFLLLIFAAKGYDDFLRRIPVGRLRQGFVLAVGLLLVFELYPKQIAWNPLPREAEIDEVYTWIAQQDDIEALVELPIRRPPSDTLYMYLQTFHWKPIANGFSGYFPKAYQDLRSVCCFPVPDEVGLRQLREMGVSHVVLHKRRKNWKRWQRERIFAFVERPDIEEVYARPWVWVFKILPERAAGAES